MFCTNCGHKMNENESFCSECGTFNKHIDNNEKQENHINQNSQETLSQHLLRKNPFKTFVYQITYHCKEFVKKYKKMCVIGSVSFLAIIGFMVLFKTLFGFEKLKWNDSYSDLHLKYVTQTRVKLDIEFSNKEKIKDIKYDSTCGKIKSNGEQIIWDLRESIGNCSITVNYKLKKLTKEFKVIPFNIEDKELVLDNKINLDSDEDLDLDGLTNKQEKKYKTNPLLSDSDMDGLDDYYEIFTSKTDPNKKDSDGDGLNDSDEIKLGLDPLKADSKGDGVKDGERVLTYDYSSDYLKMQIKGKGNIASTIAKVQPNTKISGKKGLMDILYTFYTDGMMNEATVMIPYTNDQLEKYGLNEDQLSLYYYNTQKSSYEKVDTAIDKEKKVLTATLKHFSSYVVGDMSLMQKESTNQILFILDNSWSMYTNDQYRKITGKEYYGGLFNSSQLEGSDAEGRRFSLTSELIDTLSKSKYKIGLSEFRSDYGSLLKIGSDKRLLKEKLKSMNGHFITKKGRN